MRESLRDLVTTLVDLLPADECALLLRLCAAIRNGDPPALNMISKERAAAQRLAARFASVISYQGKERKLIAVSTQATSLLLAVAKTVEVPALPADPVKAILASQDRGDNQQALALFEDNGGIFFMHFHGKDACLGVLNRFTREFSDDEEILVLARAMHALKAGNVPHARFLMVHRFGDDMLNLETVIRKKQEYSLAVRLFRFLMSLYEDLIISSDLRALLFDMLAELPIDNHLLRGSFYNAMLTVCLQHHELKDRKSVV